MIMNVGLYLIHRADKAAAKETREASGDHRLVHCEHEGVPVRIAVLVRDAPRWHESAQLTVQVYGPAGFVGALYRAGFVGGSVRKSALVVFDKMQKLDDRAEACSWHETDVRHPSALMRKHEIVENVKGQGFCRRTQHIQ